MPFWAVFGPFLYQKVQKITRKIGKFWIKSSRTFLYKVCLHFPIYHPKLEVICEKKLYYHFGGRHCTSGQIVLSKNVFLTKMGLVYLNCAIVGG